MDKEVRLNLTDSEWINLVDGEEGELSICCTTVSDLRDYFFQIIREGRNNEVMDYWLAKLKESIIDFAAGHSILNKPILLKVCNQIGLDISQFKE
jgi:hypothetical protein